MTVKKFVFGRKEERAFAPHCDQAVLHAPGECEHCDSYPDWQELRQKWGIAFTGQTFTDKEREEQGFWKIVPCPSEQRRDISVINRWGGNVAKKAASDGDEWLWGIVP